MQQSIFSSSMEGLNDVTNNVFGFQVSKSRPTLVPPAKETPKGLYFLSNLDQNKIRLNPMGRPIDMKDPMDRYFLLTSLEENMGMVVSTIYCFKASKRSNEAATRVMKEALSRVLVHYYPFAGRLRVSSDEKLIVECTGEGAIFVEAEANCIMEDLGDPLNPNPTILGKLMYDFTINGPQSILDIPLLMVQVTKFKCGGFTLGMRLNHCMVDGVSGTRFVNAWGEIARGLPLKEQPFLDRTLLKSRIPPTINYKHPEFEGMMSAPFDLSGRYEEGLHYKTFVLDPKWLERVKFKAIDIKAGLKWCTTFEALSAFVWRARAISMRSKKGDDNFIKPSKLVFPVDGRSRLNPPLPKGYFGNAIVMTSCTTTEVELVNKPLAYAVGLVRKAIQGVTDGFMRSQMDYYEKTRARPVMSSVLLITTWARLPFYEADFGWGEPSHTGPIGHPMKEVVMFLPDGKVKESIVLMVALPGDAMKKFEAMVNEV